MENEENVNTSDSDSAFHPNRKSLSIAIDSNSMADDGNLIQDNNIITDIIRRSIRVRSTRVNSRVAALASSMATNGWEAKESVLHSSATNGLRRVHSSPLLMASCTHKQISAYSRVVAAGVVLDNKRSSFPLPLKTAKGRIETGTNERRRLLDSHRRLAFITSAH